MRNWQRWVGRQSRGVSISSASGCDNTLSPAHVGMDRCDRRYRTARTAWLGTAWRAADAEGAARRYERALWRAVDPDGRLAIAMRPVQDVAERVRLPYWPGWPPPLVPLSPIFTICPHTSVDLSGWSSKPKPSLSQPSDGFSQR